MCFLSGCLRNRASTWGVAIFDRMVPRGLKRLDWEWLVLMCCHAIDVCLERALVESSVQMGNGWF